MDEIKCKDCVYGEKCPCMYSYNCAACLTIRKRRKSTNLNGAGGKMERTCENCKYGGWYRSGYDATMMDDECGGCTETEEKWEPDCKPDGIILDDDGY